MKPPSKTDRELCWKAKDEYFACLDKNGLWLNGLAPKTHQEVVDINPQNLKFDTNNKELNKCSETLKLYENACLSSWFRHFQVLRVQEKQKAHWMDRIKQTNEKDKEFWDSVKNKE